MIIIKKNWEFDDIYAKHQKIVGKFFLALYKKESFLDDFYLGIVVSRKVGNAVVRNRVKRRIRAFFRENINILPQKRKALLIARQEVNNASWVEINLDLNNIIKTITSDEFL